MLSPARRSVADWDDNAAGYSFWSSNNITKWGTPETIFKLLKASYASQEIPIQQWELDPRGEHGAQRFTSRGWCYTNWTAWDPSVFPSGDNIRRDLLGNQTAVYYMSPFCNSTPHRKDYDFVDIGRWDVELPPFDHPQPELAESHPRASYDFYTSILRVGKERWAMEMLFLDFICFRGPHLRAALSGQFGAGTAWLAGATTAAQDLGLEVQYCMACPFQAMYGNFDIFSVFSSALHTTHVGQCACTALF